MAAIAEDAGLHQFIADVQPADKKVFVTELQTQVKIVAMEPDGINDSHTAAQPDMSLYHHSAIANQTDLTSLPYFLNAFRKIWAGFPLPL